MDSSRVATGTSKTVTLQVFAEGLSDAGVPVFAGSGAICFIYYCVLQRHIERRAVTRPAHGAAEKDTNINYLIPVDADETHWC
jgi:hypothetical protein